MTIAKTKYADIEILKSWFSDKESSYYWCGPGLRYPFTNESFIEDIHWEKMATYSLLNENGEFVGFGQYFKKIGRCHLARLVVSPFQRSKGVGSNFIFELMNIGMMELGTKECSLFVVNYNEKAINCYKSLGFKNKNIHQTKKFSRILILWYIRMPNKNQHRKAKSVVRCALYAFVFRRGWR